MIATDTRVITAPDNVDVVTLARRIDPEYRLQLNPDQRLWEVAKERVNGRDIVRLCVDTLNPPHSNIVHRVHVYGYGKGTPNAGIIFVAASRYGGTWRIASNQFARMIGMDLLFNVCRDEIVNAWPDLGGHADLHRLFDDLAEEARKTMLDCHWTPERAAEHVVDYFLCDRGWV